MMRAYQPIKPKDRLYEDIVSQIQELIVSGTLQPGDRIPAERQLAEQLSVSRTAVREAIKSLAERGLVEILVGRGTFVTTPSPERVAESITLMVRAERGSVNDLQVARELLEIPVARMAAAHRTDHDVEVLTGLVAEMAASFGQPARFIEADTQFHIMLARATGNPVLQVLVQAIVALMKEERSYMIDLKGELAAALASHREILAHVVGQDAAAAERAMREHLTHVRNVVSGADGR